MTLTHTTAHVTEALARFAKQFKDLPNLTALVTAWVEQVQDIEDAAWELIDERTLETAVGVQLDGLGAIVGEDRKGKSDAEYLLWIKARMLINKASGTTPDLLSILDIVHDDDGAYRTSYPAGLTMIADGILSLPTATASILSEAVAAGVDADLHYSTTSDATTFTFADADAVQASAVLGWADDTPVTAGGFWADALEIS